MSLQETVSLPEHPVHGDELQEVWKRLMSFSNAVIGEAGVVIEELHDDVVGDFKVIHIAA